MENLIASLKEDIQYKTNLLELAQGIYDAKIENITAVSPILQQKENEIISAKEYITLLCQTMTDANVEIPPRV